MNDMRLTKTLKFILQTHDKINWTAMFTTLSGGVFCGDGDTTGKAQSSDSQQDFDLLPNIACEKLVGMMKPVLTSQLN